MNLGCKRILAAAAALCLLLSACGKGDVKAYDPASAAQALLNSGAFTDTLEELDRDVAVVYYGLDGDTVQDCAVYTSLSAGAEEIAVFVLRDEAAAKAALEALNSRVEDQKAALKDYQPDEVTKLDGAIVEQRGNSALLAVAADGAAARAALDALE